VTRPRRIFEAVLYAEDLAAAERFYHEALGLEVIEGVDLFAVFRVCAPANLEDINTCSGFRPPVAPTN
jgi:catechol 2,3-dioxygenase-like lactoylglutathione lyase family enzyme